MKTGTEGAEPTAPSPKPATGSSMLAEALKLHDEGSSQEAIGAAQQAIVLFQKEIDSGENVDAAERGIRIAKSKIEVWQQSIVVSE